MARESAFGKLNRHFHEHPQGRLHEFLFWAGIGLVLGVTAYVTWRQDLLATPLAMLLGIIALCFVGWAFLPQKKTKSRPPPKGKRGEIAERVRKSKAEKKKGGFTPGPPIRRG